MTTLEERLDKIRSPKLQNQQQTAVVLSAVEDTLRDQQTQFTPAAYFSALLALLTQATGSNDTNVKSDVVTTVVGLLDIVTHYAPPALLRSKFSQIFTHLFPAISQSDADAPLLRPCIGCLESLLLVQDAAAWQLPAAQIGPRRGVLAILSLSLDHRPKVRKRAQDALAKVLENPPPSPSLDHPVADMCAETAMKQLADLISVAESNRKRKKGSDAGHDPKLIHSLQLIKTIAVASRGWPSRKIENLCDLLLNITKSSHEYLTMAAFDVFEVMFANMADEASAKLPRLIEVITQLKPSRNDSQLLPPWIAILSRAYEVSGVVSPEETFQQLPELFVSVASYLDSSSHNIRISASECLISFMVNCVPDQVILEPSIYDEKALEKLARAATNLLSVQYQAAWKETFGVLSAMFEAFLWRADPLMRDVVVTIGDLRGNEAFADKKEADAVLGKAIEAMGPRALLDILPLNLVNPKAGQPGRAWLLPVLRDHIANTELAHFRSELVPISEVMFQRVLEHGQTKMTMEIKIFETVVQQLWATLPGYCTLTTDVATSFDQTFAELLTNVLYQHVVLRPDICKALQALIESNKAILELEEEEPIQQKRLSKIQAQSNIDHLATSAGSWLAVLFNIYSETLPQFRGYILNCINAWLSITKDSELMETFTRVTTLLQESLQAPAPSQAEKQKQTANSMPPTSHTLMDLVITMSIYLPRESFSVLFNIAATILGKADDPQLQKKAYKLIPRLATSETGAAALVERNPELQVLLLQTAESTSAPARRDRLEAIAQVVQSLPSNDLHFIPSVLSEVVISTKETNEKARTSAFDLLVLMGQKMKEGGTVINSKVAHMPDDAPTVSASLDEFFTMVSAGLAGSTPHMISASITALTRVLFEFRAELKEDLMTELVSTMDLFLTSSNREIVASVLGFVKVAVISLPAALMESRLPSLIKNLMVWSHEHKAHFRVKVKHILERIIRRFGLEVAERNIPEEDKKLITNIRKTRERRKRKKEAGEEGESEDEGEGKRNGQFASSYDEAVHNSSDEDEDDSDIELTGRKQRAGRNAGSKNGAYIVEDPSEPLDLLDRRSLANISSVRPASNKRKLNAAGGASGKLGSRFAKRDGKLVISEENGVHTEEAMDVDPQLSGKENHGSGTNAYIDAVAGKDAYQRGRGGRIKFSNRKGGGPGDDEMEVDDEDGKAIAQARSGGRGRGGGRGGRDMGRGGGRGGRGGRGGSARPQSFRRGLDGEKRRDGSGFGGGGGGGRGGSGSRGRGIRVMSRGRVGKTFRGRGQRR